MVEKHAHIHAVFGAALIGLFLLSVLFISPNVAPEFSGSASLRVSFYDRQNYSVVDAVLDNFAYSVSVERISEKEYLFLTRSLDDAAYTELTAYITGEVGAYTVTEYQSFSPSISQELVRKSFIALVAAALIIIGYISFVFRGVSRPVESWKYGVVATIALLHDVIVPLGVFALLSLFSSAAVDTLFVTALLATLGYSINDTIVIFDRVRERLHVNQRKGNREEFGAVVDYGVRNSLRRSVYTSVSTMIPLVLLFVFVPVTKWFSVALFVGVVAGTYSSLFFAPSLLLLWSRYFPQGDRKERESTDTERAEEALRGVLRGNDTL